MKSLGFSPKRAFTGILLTSTLGLALAGCGGGSSTGGVHPGCTPGSNNSLPKLANAHKIGFSENSLDGAWRNAEQSSMQSEATARGFQLISTNANNSDNQQVQDINTLISDNVDALVIAPLTEDAEAAAIIKARQQCIPVFLVDRNANESLASPGHDFVTFLGSDFEQQGQRAADAMIEAMGGPSATGNVIELKGSTGASPAILRSAGFDEELAAKAPGIKIVAQQDANFDRTTAQKVTATLIQQFPNVQGLFGANDEEAIGAITALNAAGKHPGTDIKVVSIDGTKDGTNLILQGQEYAIIESNPHFGKITFDAIQSYENGQSVPAWIVVQDREFKLADGTAAAYINNGAF